MHGPTNAKLASHNQERWHRPRETLPLSHYFFAASVANGKDCKYKWVTLVAKNDVTYKRDRSMTLSLAH